MAAFIVFEGGDGSGKSTQARMLAESLTGRGLDVVLTFEPGATPRGAQIRALLLGDESAIDARTELLMMLADRAQHVAEVVRPALARDAIVISDRFEPSSLAYQGVGRGLGVEVVSELSAFARGGVDPDVVLLLDVSDEVAAARRPVAEDRIEKAGAEFHSRVRASYRDLALRFGWTIINGEGSPEAVAARVGTCVGAAIGPAS